MKGLTPDEFAALQRLLLHIDLRPDIHIGSADDDCFMDLVEQGRALYWTFPEGHPDFNEYQGHYEITDAGREAIKLWPLMQAIQEIKNES